jgi:hypothetical protein
MSRLNLSQFVLPLLCHETVPFSVRLSLCVRSLHCPILFNRTCSSTCVDVHPPCVVMRFIKIPRGVIGVGLGMTTECVERNFSLNYPDVWRLRNYFFCVLELGALCVVSARLCAWGLGAEKRNCTETRDSATGSAVRTEFGQRGFIVVRPRRPGFIPRAVVGFVVDGVALWPPPPPPPRVLRLPNVSFHATIAPCSFVMVTDTWFMELTVTQKHSPTTPQDKIKAVENVLNGTWV